MPTCLARVKINLYLHVGPRREDGLHTIDSLVISPPIGDCIAITPAKALRARIASEVPVTLQIDGPFAAHLTDVPSSENLVYKAALALYHHSPDAAFPVHIKLTKNVPPASGLGGGTSDAMATLYTLNKLWEIGAGDTTLLALAFKIGADGPACLMSHLAQNHAIHVTGAGEGVRPVAGFTALSLLLVNPGKAIPTRIAFHQLAKRRASGQRSCTPPWPRPTPFSTHDTDIHSIMRTSTNDLQAPAVDLAPEIETVLDILAQSQGCLKARMSGSGATCFGVYTDRDMAMEACKSFSTTPYWYALAHL